jgi:acetolactate synthase-1/2/3 large subunit
VAATTAQAILESRKAPGCIASLILPADTAWQDAGEFRQAPPMATSPAGKKVPKKALEHCARIIREEEDILILLGGKTLRESSLEWAGKLSSHCGVSLMTEFAAARTQRGVGRVHVPRMPYAVDVALEATKRFKHAILVNTKSPVAFFAYPNKPSLLLAEDCQIHTLATVPEDGPQALVELAKKLGAESAEIQRTSPNLPKMPSGKLDSDTISAVVANVLPEEAIVSDESISMGRNLLDFTKGCPQHDWLFITGGSIGQGMPLATGAAVACRDRPVLSLSGDGSAMYTLQSLWTQSREQLNVTTVIYANRSYAILHAELRNVGAQPGKNTRLLFDLENPYLNWVEMAAGMGVEGVRVETAEALQQAMRHGFSTPGPYLIEAIC